jgi:opacity protein-like surface antigen
MKRTVLFAVLLAAATPAAQAQTASDDPRLTRRGWEVGVQGSKYHYEEPDFAQLTGNRAGVVGAYTFTDDRHWFSRIDGRISYGKLKYEGSGTIDNVPDWIGEIRAVAGKDFLFGGSLALSPYIGLGYRYLYDDLRGYSSTGDAGYRRYSNYVYAPVGLTLRINTGGQFVIAPAIEYDAFIQGRQVTKLSDTGIAGVQDVSNEQTKGYGYRASLMFEINHWAVGPWLSYWSIKDSDVQCFTAVVNGQCLAGQEPANWTREWGVDLRYRF